MALLEMTDSNQWFDRFDRIETLGLQPELTMSGKGVPTVRPKPVEGPDEGSNLNSQ